LLYKDRLLWDGWDNCFHLPAGDGITLVASKNMWKDMETEDPPMRLPRWCGRSIRKMVVRFAFNPPRHPDGLVVGETGQPGAGMYGNPLFYRGTGHPSSDRNKAVL
jgi:hypothetical protein